METTSVTELAVSEATDGVWGLLLKAGRSINGLNYPASVLEAAAPLFSSIVSFLGHPSGTPNISNVVGLVQESKWDSTLGGILGKIQLKEGLTLAKVQESFNGISWKGLVDVDPLDASLVSRIVAVHSVDFVPNPPDSLTEYIRVP